jgi:hypothetical protein
VPKGSCYKSLKFRAGARGGYCRVETVDVKLNGRPSLPSGSDLRFSVRLGFSVKLGAIQYELGAHVGQNSDESKNERF